MPAASRSLKNAKSQLAWEIKSGSRGTATSSDGKRPKTTAMPSPLRNLRKKGERWCCPMEPFWTQKHGHFTYGYCQTSHSSQSKSVNHVLVAQSSESFVASSREQFYVSVSRGKSTIKIFTDSRRGLAGSSWQHINSHLPGIELAGISRRDLAENDHEIELPAMARPNPKPQG